MLMLDTVIPVVASRNKFLDNQAILEVAKQVFLDETTSINQIYNNLGAGFLDAINIILNCEGKVVVAGMGKSGHIARKIAATFASTGTPAFFVHPAEALHGDLGMIDNKDVVIAISYSGESEELISILPVLRRKHVPIIAMTSSSTSTLAKISNCILDIKVDKEACPLGLAPTSSTTVTLVLGDALAVSLLTIRGFKKEDFALSHPGGSLGRKLLTTAGDIMRTGIYLPIVSQETLLHDVVVEISQKGLGLAGVVDNTGKLLGVITDGDLRRLLDKFGDCSATLAKEIMNPTPKTVHVDSLAVTAVDIMEKEKITGFLVVDDDNKLLGAFNVHDLFKARLL